MGYGLKILARYHHVFRGENVRTQFTKVERQVSEHTLIDSHNRLDVIPHLFSNFNSDPSICWTALVAPSITSRPPFACTLLHHATTSATAFLSP